MNINDLIAIVKKKIQKNILIEQIIVEDKSFLHKNHLSHQKGKFHLKLIITSATLKKLNRIDSNKRIYEILDQELKEHIHYLQIFS